MNILISILISLAIVGGSMLIPNQYGGDDYDSLGATSYPTSLDSLVNPSPTDRTNVVSHSSQHANANDAIEALQAKVGVTGSAVTTSHDYKLGGVTGSDKACSLAGTEILTNKTLTSPVVNSPTIATGTLATSSLTYTRLQASTTLNGTTTINGITRINLGSDATGDIYYRNSTGLLTRLGVGSNGNFLTLSSGIPAWSSVSAVAPVGGVSATSTASTSVGISVDGTNFVQVFAYGSVRGDNNAESSNVQLFFGTSTVDQFDYDDQGNADTHAFSLMWFGTPSATNTTLLLTKDDAADTFIDATIIYYKY